MKTKPIQYYKGIRIKADTGLHEQIASIIGKSVSAGARVLDFGAGEGALSQRLRDNGYDVLSVDINATDFKAGTHFHQLNFNHREEVLTFIEQYSEAFEVVLGVEVIEHVENPWQYIRDLKRLCKSGGLILLTTPNVSSWYSRLNFFLKGRFHQFEDIDRAYGHINPVCEDELRYICEQMDLTVKSIWPGGWLPRLWLSGNPVICARNLLGFIGSLVMKGIYDGWCLIVLIEKSSGD